MKLCIFSNSHGGSLKAGWAKLTEAERDGVEPTFFAATGAQLRHLVRDGACLRTRNSNLQNQLRVTSGGLAEVDPTAYDAFWIHALGFAQLQWPEPGGAHYSRGFLTALTVAGIKASQAWRLHDLLRGLTPKPIHLTPNPLHSEQVAPAKKDAVPEAPTPSDLTPPLSASLSGATTLHFQPEITITRRYYTARVYSQDAVLLRAAPGGGGEEAAATDFTHMNASYGALVWRQILAELQRAA
jgi:hypothetical protein